MKSKSTSSTDSSPNTQKKPNILRDLAILFSVPISILLVAIAVVYSPKLFANPQQDFLYQVCGGSRYECQLSYVVRDGVVTDSGNGSTNVSLYYYDVSEETSRPIDIAEAQKLTLNASSKSSDGYTLKYRNDQYGGLFWSSSERGWRLEKGWLHKDIELTDRYTYYSGDATSPIIGWVK